VTVVLQSLPLAADLGAARSQMAFTLGFHIILAWLGVAFPAIMLIANYRGLRRGDCAGAATATTGSAC
jgi:cytochrome d ubiquinol oxidase subunit I